MNEETKQKVAALWEQHKHLVYKLAEELGKRTNKSLEICLSYAYEIFHKAAVNYNPQVASFHNFFNYNAWYRSYWTAEFKEETEQDALTRDIRNCEGKQVHLKPISRSIIDEYLVCNVSERDISWVNDIVDFVGGKDAFWYFVRRCLHNRLYMLVRLLFAEQCTVTQLTTVFKLSHVRLYQLKNKSLNKIQRRLYELEGFKRQFIG